MDKTIGAVTDRRSPNQYCIQPLILSIAIVMMFIAGGCVTRNTEFARDYYNLGVGYLDQGDYAQAQQYFARALDLDPGLTRASYNLARAYLLLGEPGRSIQVLEDLLVADPENTLVRETLAFAYGANDDWDQAAYIMEAVANEQEISVRGWVNYTVTLIELERYSAALHAADRALVLDPDSHRAKTLLVLAAAYMPERLDEYEDVLAEVVAKAPDSRAVSMSLGDALEYAERFDAALKLYEVAAQIHVEQGELSFRHGRLLIEVAGEEQQGLNVLTQAVSRGFDDRERLSDVLSQVDGEVPEALLEPQEEDDDVDSESGVPAGELPAINGQI